VSNLQATSTAQMLNIEPTAVEELTKENSELHRLALEVKRSGISDVAKRYLESLFFEMITNNKGKIDTMMAPSIEGDQFEFP
jgi:hypothetical protein